MALAEYIRLEDKTRGRLVLPGQSRRANSTNFPNGLEIHSLTWLIQRVSAASRQPDNCR
jgi:hypothetical protein